MCKVEDIFNGEVVSLMEMLDARERRSAYQQALLKRYPNTTLLSATMNVPGPIKSSFELELAFEEIVTMIRVQYSSQFDELKHHKTGPEYYAIYSIEPHALKRDMLKMEMSHPLGRLMDLDVLWVKEGKINVLSRKDLDYPARQCYMCGKDAKACGRERRHSVEDLQQHIADLIIQTKTMKR